MGRACYQKAGLSSELLPTPTSADRRHSRSLIPARVPTDVRVNCPPESALVFEKCGFPVRIAREAAIPRLRGPNRVQAWEIEEQTNGGRSLFIYYVRRMARIWHPGYGEPAHAFCSSRSTINQLPAAGQARPSTASSRGFGSCVSLGLCAVRPQLIELIRKLQARNKTRSRQARRHLNGSRKRNPAVRT